MWTARHLHAGQRQRYLRQLQHRRQRHLDLRPQQHAANVQALNEGDTRTETFTVTTADGTPATSPSPSWHQRDPHRRQRHRLRRRRSGHPIPVTLTGADVDGTVTSLTLADLPANGTPTAMPP
jgi:hypothetical protein